MAKKDLEQLIGRAVLDSKFREDLFEDPEKAIREAGFELTEEELEGLRALDPEAARQALESLSSTVEQPWS